jgi:hypothetical protein
MLKTRLELLGDFEVLAAEESMAARGAGASESNAAVAGMTC